MDGKRHERGSEIAFCLAGTLVDPLDMYASHRKESWKMARVAILFGSISFLCCSVLFARPVYAHDAFEFLASTKSGVKTYSDLLADCDSRISGVQRLVAQRPNDWVMRERLAGILLEKAQLTNDIKDYTAVQKIFDEALAIAPKGSGPLLSAARFNYTIHRLARAEEYLNTVEHRPIIKTEDPLSILIIRSDLAYHRGEYEKALAGYHRCELALPGLCISQLATYYAHTGGYTEATSLLHEALNRADVKNMPLRAFINLELGILFTQRGQYQEAEKVLTEAEQLLPGWWLAQGRNAELLTIRGRWNDAIPIYKEIVAKTSLPQYMDALAECYQHVGQPALAEPLISEADKLWQEQLQLFPESASAHALGHYLKFTNNISQIIKLAEENVKNRPGGEAQLYLVQAYLKAERSADAKRVMEALLQTPFRSAELFDTARQLYERLGLSDKAEAQRQLCLTINPQYYSQPSS